MPSESLTRATVRSDFSARLEHHRSAWQYLERRDLALGYAKIAAAILFVIVLWVVLGLLAIPAWTAFVPLAFFLGFAVSHDRVIRDRQRSQSIMAFYEQGLRRIDDRWMGTGKRGDRFADPEHSYAVDLDVFGRGSLFELLCTARTRAGEETLAEWLKSPAFAETVRARQEAVADLSPRLDLREQAASLVEEGLTGIDPDALSSWGRNPPLLPPSIVPALAVLLGASTVAAGVSWAAGRTWIPFVILAVFGQILERSQHSRLKKVIREVDKPAKDLGNLAELLKIIERSEFRSPLLIKLQGAVKIEGHPASERIARLEGLVDKLNARRNPIFGPIAALVLWTTIWGFAIERWRVETGAHLDQWLAAVGEFEALSALAGFAHEHPQCPFPVIEEDGVIFEGTALKHPLLPDTEVVANDVTLSDSATVWIVSGSNMSGKSTLLRTVGTNSILALAGAPVCAESLRISPFQIGASIRTMDSLQGGISRFYAEVLRLRQIVRLSESGGLLFLLDEILQGTNSHDRLIGAEAVVKALVQKGAIGLVTTHDLALARIVDEPDSPAANVHFQDHMEDGEMKFDYRLQPGVVTKSNALELMRSVGLEV